MRGLLHRLLSRAYARIPRLPERAARAWAPAVGQIPFARLAVPLDRARVALVTAGGVHLATDPPFDMQDPDGDSAFHVIPSSASRSALTITHDYYDHAAADSDVNVVFPFERLSELVAEGVVGEAAPRHIGLMGHLFGVHLDRLRDETGPRIADLFEQDAVHAVVLVPG